MSKKPIKSAEELEVYQLAYAVAMEIFEETKNFNRDEKFSLTDQIRRSGCLRQPSGSMGEAEIPGSFCFQAHGCRCREQ